MRTGTVLAALLAAALLPPAAAGGQSREFTAVVEEIVDGVVMIEAKGKDSVHYGTGFVLERPDVVVTAFHVVEGAGEIRVARPGGFTISGALLVAGSAPWDLAVLKVGWPAGAKAQGIPLARGRGMLPVGTEIAYTGYGYGNGSGFDKVISTYRGIISSHLPHGEGHLYQLGSLVNGGLSGSPLYLPGTGEVVGVVTRHFGPPGAGIGFGGATPAEVLERMVENVFTKTPRAVLERGTSPGGSLTGLPAPSR